MKRSNGRRVFAEGRSFYKLFLIFIIFSLLGTAAEGLYWIIRYGHFAMRSGLVYGPFCIIYGFAAVLLLLLLYRFKDRGVWFLFVASYVVAVLFELFCSLFQQWAFGFTSWDYSTSRFSILGRANLLYAVPWGLFGVFFMKVLYKKISNMIEDIPVKAGTAIVWILLIFMIFDCTVSTAATIRFSQRQNHVPATNIVQQELDRHFPDSRLEKVYSRILKGRQ
jgi:uncharacterized membrane protein